MPERTWTGDLRPLRDLLTREARAADTGRAWRVLEDGTLVAVLLAPDAPPVLRLAREDAPEGWETAFQQIAARLGCGDWPREPEADGRAVALRYMQPETMRTIPCIAGCGRQAPAEKASYIGLCSPCTEARRVASGYAPVPTGSTCVRCGRPLDANAKLYGEYLCSTCEVRAAGERARRAVAAVADEGGDR